MNSFAGAVVVGVLAAGSLLQSQGQAQSAKPFRPGPGVTSPTVLEYVHPTYPDGARHARIEGTVELEAIVLVDGTVGDVRVTKSLDQVHGLDAAAVAAVKKWLFRSGRYQGKAAPVIVTVILEFNLSASQPSGRLAERLTPAPSFRQKEDEFLKGTYPDTTPDLVLPKLLKQSQPRYTSEAMRQLIQGTVVIQAVVMPDGRVGRARVLKSLDKDFGLDAAALAAARTWRFEPARLKGEPVPVAVELVLEFKLH